ncbi:division plane positioning ATPase MipZ [Burkholderia cenocepacia]|uniref:nucleotide-binding protein n=1 Tax=Burkholderia cenocepacia TaxID=95486 RepID=UPI0023BA32A2|nr:division plane positioning ATPase MipZ [Burkholderia cenocepacia]MDF0506587.1 division plane positioning ATPase MipZ [Burkholderia cenocepacia]
MPSITVVAHTKGGTSKSTTAVNLATMSQAAGRDTVLVDSDTGQSSRRWAGARAANSALPFIQCVTLFDNGGDYHRQLRALAERHDEVIVDVGGEGQGAREIRLALTVANRVVTPCRPAPADVQRLDAMHAMIDQALDLNPDLDAMLFPVQASTNAKASDVVTFYEKAAEFPRFRLLEAVVCMRDAYKAWPETGEAIFEQAKLDKKAMAEMSKLFKEVFNG